MLSETTWHSLGQFKEFIVNGLDLLSFVFLTPLLIRTIRPVFGSLPNFIAGWLVLCAFMLLSFIPLSIAGYYFPNQPTDGWFFWMFVIVFGAAMLFLMRYADSVGDWAEERYRPLVMGLVVRHSTTVGISLFFLSRMFAFGLASHETFGFPR